MCLFRKEMAKCFVQTSAVQPNRFAFTAVSHVCELWFCACAWRRRGSSEYPSELQLSKRSGKRGKVLMGMLCNGIWAKNNSDGAALCAFTEKWVSPCSVGLSPLCLEYRVGDQNLVQVTEYVPARTRVSVQMTHVDLENRREIGDEAVCKDVAGEDGILSTKRGFNFWDALPSKWLDSYTSGYIRVSYPEGLSFKASFCLWFSLGASHRNLMLMWTLGKIWVLVELDPPEAGPCSKPTEPTALGSASASTSHAPWIKKEKQRRLGWKRKCEGEESSRQQEHWSCSGPPLYSLLHFQCSSSLLSLHLFPFCSVFGGTCFSDPQQVGSGKWRLWLICCRSGRVAFGTSGFGKLCPPETIIFMFIQNQIPLRSVLLLPR